MFANRFAYLIACVAVVPLAMTAVTEPIELNVDYKLYGFAPVECQNTPIQTGTFITSHCHNLGIRAYDGKLNVPLDRCTLHFWNQTNCLGGEGTPIPLPGGQESSCESLALEASRLPGVGNPPTDLAQSVKVECPNISK
ncbi:unnamed protein product [Peniophora sp. CBMAI 1063]|nr:unnamed protein product [Peniophora sp. CBMAI 1063]